MVSRPRRSIAAAIAVAFALLPGACFYDWDLTQADSDGGLDSGSSDGTTDSGTHDGAVPDVTPDVPILGDGSGDDTGPNPGSCKSGLNDCPSAYFCKFAGHECGSPDAATPNVGLCTAIPPSCNGTIDGLTSWCTCSGITFPTECDAYKSGNDLSILGCAQADGTSYACGYLYCERAKSACLFHAAGGTYECLPPGKVGCSPAAAVSCGCVSTSVACNGFGTCTDVDGGVYIKCQ
jgi:hypothetical protein